MAHIRTALNKLNRLRTDRYFGQVLRKKCHDPDGDDTPILACLHTGFWLWNTRYLVHSHAWMEGGSNVEHGSSTTLMAQLWQHTIKQRGIVPMVDTPQSVLVTKFRCPSQKRWKRREW